jgi:hypothetical protein
MLSMRAEQVHFPRPSDGTTLVAFEWTLIHYCNVISMLKNPFYAGAYAYGKVEKRTEIVNGQVHTNSRHPKPLEEWDVLLKDHHEGYIDWAEFERNQTHLAVTAYSIVGGAKSGRGGRALLAGPLSCGHCGRRLVVDYTGGPARHLVYQCEQAHRLLGLPRCPASGLRVDAAIARELLRAVEPMAIERAEIQEGRVEQQRIVELELQQA